jgi:hypothetical protein
VDRNVNVALNQEVVDGLGVFVLASVGGTKNGTDTNGVFVDQIYRLLGVDYVAVLCAVDVLFLDVKVTSSLLPTHLDSRVHDYVGTRVVLALCLALVGPGPLHSECCEHDGLGRADGRCAHGVGVVVVGGNVEEAGNHVDTAVLDVGRDGVLFVVDKVLCKSVNHDLLCFGLHVGCDKGCQAVRQVLAGVRNMALGENGLESGVAVQSQVILDHAVCHIGGHFLVGHLISGEILGCKAAAIDALLKVVGLSTFGTKLRKINVFSRALGNLRIVGDLSEMNHSV